MHLRRKLLKLALPMVVEYFIDPQLGATRRQIVTRKVQRMWGRGTVVDKLADGPPMWSSSTVVSETVSERLVMADVNGRVVSDAIGDVSASDS